MTKVVLRLHRAEPVRGCGICAGFIHAYAWGYGLSPLRNADSWRGREKRCYCRVNNDNRSRSLRQKRLPLSVVEAEANRGDDK